MSCLRKCPRCGEHTLERLNTYSHCAECLYYEDYWGSAESDFYDAVKALEEIEKTNHSNQTQVNYEDDSEPQLLENTLKGA